MVRVVQLTSVLPQIFLGSSGDGATRSSGDRASTWRSNRVDIHSPIDEHLDGLEPNRIHRSIAKQQVGEKWLSEYEEMIHKRLALVVPILDGL